MLYQSFQKNPSHDYNLDLDMNVINALLGNHNSYITQVWCEMKIRLESHLSQRWHVFPLIFLAHLPAKESELSMKKLV